MVRRDRFNTQVIPVTYLSAFLSAYGEVRDEADGILATRALETVTHRQLGDPIETFGV